MIPRGSYVRQVIRMFKFFCGLGVLLAVGCSDRQAPPPSVLVAIDLYQHGLRVEDLLAYAQAPARVVDTGRGTHAVELSDGIVYYVQRLDAQRVGWVDSMNVWPRNAAVAAQLKAIDGGRFESREATLLHK